MIWYSNKFGREIEIIFKKSSQNSSIETYASEILKMPSNTYITKEIKRKKKSTGQIQDIWTYSVGGQNS